MVSGVLLSGETWENTPGITPILLAAAGLAWMGILQLPSVYYAARAVFSPTSTPTRITLPRWFWGVSVFVFALAVWIGDRVSAYPHVDWLVLPLLHVVVITLPVFWSYLLGARRLPSPASQRVWGVLSLSLTISPLMILFLEVGLLILFLSAWAIYLFTNPVALDTVIDLSQRLANVSDVSIMQEVLVPYMTNPAVLIVTLLFAALLVPLLEEAFKPLGMMFLLRRGVTPAQGFVLGLVCGAGYALFESLLMGSAAAGWTTVVLGRAATSLLHTTNGGLVGWGLASVWGSRHTKKSKRTASWLRLAGAYALAVLMHGLWNGLTLLGVWTELVSSLGGAEHSPVLVQIGRAAPVGIVAIAAGYFVILITANLVLARTTKPLRIQTPETQDTI